MQLQNTKGCYNSFLGCEMIVYVICDENLHFLIDDYTWYTKYNLAKVVQIIKT